MEVKETNQYLQDYGFDIIKSDEGVEERQQGTDGYDEEEHFMHNYSWVLFFRRSLLLIELSERVNGGS